MAATLSSTAPMSALFKTPAQILHSGFFQPPQASHSCPRGPLPVIDLRNPTPLPDIRGSRKGASSLNHSLSCTTLTSSSHPKEIIMLVTQLTVPPKFSATCKALRCSSQAPSCVD